MSKAPNPRNPNEFRKDDPVPVGRYMKSLIILTDQLDDIEDEAEKLGFKLHDIEEPKAKAEEEQPKTIKITLRSHVALRKDLDRFVKKLQNR